MGFSDSLTKFNCAEFLPEGWFWLMPSRDLAKGKAKGCTFAGREFAIFRGEDGGVRVVEAYCPHMGAHLGDGLVEGNSLRCLFHNWKFDERGECTEAGHRRAEGVPPLKTYK